MCKVLAIAGVSKANDAKLWKFVTAASEEMTETDKDGFGYMAMSGDGKMFGEKWLDVDDKFKRRIADDPKLSAYRDQFGDALLYPTGGYSFLGDADGIKSHTTAIIAHARMATCGINLTNVHPFVRDGVALIHNGIIHNPPARHNVISTCDSESILACYLEGGIKSDPRNFQTTVADKLNGSYAAAVLSADGLDVFRNAGSMLSVSYVPGLEAFVFATTDEIIRRGAKAIRSKPGSIVPLRSHWFLRLDSSSGKVVESFPWSAATTQPTYYSNWKKGREWDAETGKWVEIDDTCAEGA